MLNMVILLHEKSLSLQSFNKIQFNRERDMDK